MAIITPFVQVGTTRQGNFATLGPIVTAAVYWASIKSFESKFNPSINLRSHRHVILRFCTVLCFNKQLQPPGICGLSSAPSARDFTIKSVPSPSYGTILPSSLHPEFSQAPLVFLPDHLCRFGGTIPLQSEALEAFPGSMASMTSHP